MPAQSKAQQRFFGVVKAMQKGDKPKEGEAGKVAKSMKKKDVDDFASTKHKGKPEKVKKEMKVKSLIKKMVREELQETMCFDLQTERCWKGYTQKGMKKMFGKMYPNCVKIKKKKSENVAPNHDGKAAPYGSGWKKSKEIEEITKNLNEKLSKSQIKKMRDKFDKTGKLPPHLMKLAKLMDKHTEVRNIVVPGLEWMSKLGEGKLTEDYKNSEWEVYVKDEKGKEKIVKKAKSKRAATILYNKIIKRSFNK